jgi:uncharacterized protein YyaL (SSP411 family)
MSKRTLPAERQNRLAYESSPYLLQHASNPVDWYPWGEEALAHARERDKPILLSIGYSACHWCHVMAHESFEDEATAQVMNELFVNIKVDREERPDLDRIYQLAHQMLTQRGGGWPLTMFLSPHDQRPFFGGTYFPNVARFGMPPFTDLLTRVSEFYHSRREDIAQQSAALSEAFRHMLPEPATADTALTRNPLKAAREQLAADFDGEHGGFGQAPKFPHPTNIELLLREWRSTASSDAPDLHCLYMATLTLNRMAEGGLYDQLGGGFARYSVDRFWMIPHFEKMLYDNGPLLRIYAQAATPTGEELFRDTALGICEWTLREMEAPTGGYWSSLDADSEGHEGKYYVWEKAEVQSLLTSAEFEVVSKRYGFDHPPNFEGVWHLHIHRSLADIANETGTELTALQHTIASAHHKMLAHRSGRIRPARDEKILTAWNALMISGMAVAARTLGQAQCAASATRALDFIRSNLFSNGRLLAAFKDGRARFPAYLDDYAFTLQAVLDLLQTQWRSADLHFATSLAETLLEHFEDAETGGFFFTADDHEQLMHRSKSFADEAMPSGNAIAAQALTRLGLLLGEPRYLDAAARTLRASWRTLEQHPQAHASMLIALDEHLDPPEIVIIRGDTAELSRWQSAIEQLYAPKRLVFAIPSDAEELPASIGAKRAHHDTVAYVCRGTTCSEPIRSLAGLVSLTGASLGGSD